MLNWNMNTQIEKELKLKVDLVSEKALKEQLRQIILDSVKYV